VVEGGWLGFLRVGPVALKLLLGDETMVGKRHYRMVWINLLAGK
jgi:hypothetical protein